MKINNPYRPGAGLMPTFLAGREDIIKNANISFSALMNQIPVQSIAYTGYRGVGKTVLLNKLQEIAENDYDIDCYHIEVAKAGSFISKVSDSCKKFLREHSTSEKAKNMFNKALESLKALEITYNPNNSEFSLSLQDQLLYTNADMSQSLQDLFESIGAIAKRKKTAICFFIDEFQYSDQEEMDAFISALHRANQLAIPIMALCAGTPDMLKMLRKEKTYVERLFLFPRLDLLSADEVATAIAEPGKSVGLIYTDDALKEIYEITKGYPYFVQQYGQIVFNNCEADEAVDKKSIDFLKVEYLKVLDENFYMIRFEERGDLEKECLFAMSKATELPCTVAFIASELKKSTKQIAPTLARLKNRGIITYENIGEVDFTVPGFDDYLRRKIEY